MVRFIRGLIVCYLGFVIAAPLEELGSHHINVARRDATVSTFRGIYWEEAKETCTVAEFDILAEATRMADEMVNNMYGKAKMEATPSWNRYFGGDKIRFGWYHSDERKGVMTNIQNNILQVARFVKLGKQKNGVWKRTGQLTYRCKPLPGVKDRCVQDPSGSQWQGPSAVTFGSSAREDQGSTVVFCPRFFKDGKLAYLNDRTKSHIAPHTISLFDTYERIIAHEWMHGLPCGFKWPIIDVNATITGREQLGSLPVYGDGLCHDWAWNQADPSNHNGGEVNLKVGENADNYAWMFMFQWYADYFKWDTDGVNLKKRDALAVSGRDSNPSDSTAFVEPVDDNDSKDASTIDTQTLSGIPINCNLKNSESDDLVCAYIGEPYDQFVEENKGGFVNDHGCWLSAPCNHPTQEGGGDQINPDCRCTCDNKLMQLTSEKCKGFKGGLLPPF